MTTKIQKWGNSQGLRLSRQVLEEARLAVGDEVVVQVKEDGSIVIAPASQVRGKLSLAELVGRIPRNWRTGEVSWGGPVGREVW